MESALRFGSLFAGVGGFDLGLERAGFSCAWQVEIDVFCQGVLSRHWPDVPRVGNAKEFANDRKPGIEVDIIAGGFPCQPISVAGKRQGTDDPRWLWPQFARVIGVLRPRFVVMENSSNLLRVGFSGILSDLASLGFDAEWGCISAHSFGAPQRRERLFLVAYATGERSQAVPILSRGAKESASYQAWKSQWDGILARGDGARLRRIPDPGICRVASGVPRGVDRLEALGNTVVPQVAEWIGMRIRDNI